MSVKWRVKKVTGEEPYFWAAYPQDMEKDGRHQCAGEDCICDLFMSFATAVYWANNDARNGISGRDWVDN